MVNIKSAKKRISIERRNNLQNSFYKRSIRTSKKKFLSYFNIYMNSQTFENKTKLKNSLNSTYSLIDKASKKKFFHKNTAARKKSTLIKKFNTI